MKVTLITTERNEVDDIGRFLDSALSQTRPPDEIVVADGGSTDGTLEVIRAYIAEGAPVRLVEAMGNRSVGRNAAVRAATHDVIACSDVGTVLTPQWLQKLCAPFQDPAVTAVAGGYASRAVTDFQRLADALTFPSGPPEPIDTWLPSSRSVAFRKIAWRDAGGYPEHTSYNEDTPFDLALKAAGHEFVDRRDAVVLWEPRRTLKDFFWQYHWYAVGDGLDRIHDEHYRVVRSSYAKLLAVPVAARVSRWPAGGYAVYRVVRHAQRVLPAWRRHGGSAATLVELMGLALVWDAAQVSGYWRAVVREDALRTGRTMR